MKYYVQYCSNAVDKFIVSLIKIIWISLISEVGCELIIHDHDDDLCVTMLGWVGVPGKDWGDLTLYALNFAEGS